ncbi:MAG TPA: hypothetical protein VF453_06335 [Burkholderiaceae bacterium]
MNSHAARSGLLYAHTVFVEAVILRRYLEPGGEPIPEAERAPPRRFILSWESEGELKRASLMSFWDTPGDLVKPLFPADIRWIRGDRMLIVGEEFVRPGHMSNPDARAPRTFRQAWGIRILGPRPPRNAEAPRPLPAGENASV